MDIDGLTLMDTHFGRAIFAFLIALVMIATLRLSPCCRPTRYGEATQAWTGGHGWLGSILAWRGRQRMACDGGTRPTPSLLIPLIVRLDQENSASKGPRAGNSK
jgi:hypothetical protein